MKQPLVRAQEKNSSAAGSMDFLETTSRSLAIARAVTRTREIGTEPLAAPTHPTDASCRHACDQREITHILRHHRSGGDKGIGSDCVAADDRGIGPNRCAAP